MSDIFMIIMIVINTILIIILGYLIYTMRNDIESQITNNLSKKLRGLIPSVKEQKELKDMKKRVAQDMNVIFNENPDMLNAFPQTKEGLAKNPSGVNLFGENIIGSIFNMMASQEGSPLASLMRPEILTLLPAVKIAKQIMDNRKDKNKDPNDFKREKPVKRSKNDESYLSKTPFN